MKINQKGIDLVKFYESLHDGDLSQIGLQPKMDPIGIWTVGYGHALIDPFTKKFLKGKVDKIKAYEQWPKLNEEQATTLLENDLTSFSKGVVSLIKNKLNTNQFSALVSFTFNCGGDNFRKSTLLKKVNKDPNNPSIRDEFGKWIKADGQILNGLVRRRNAEANLYFDPIVIS